MNASTDERLAILESHTRALHGRLERVEAELRVRPAAPPPAGAPAPRPPAAVRSPLPPPRTARPVRARRELDLEELLGGRLLALVGGVAVVLGLAFLVALAVDRGWIGEWARVSLAFGGSLALLAGGAWLVERRGRTQAALAAVGTAIAGLFLSVTAAGSLYGLVPDVVALAAALVVGAAAAALAVRWQSRSVAALGVGGALLAPVYAAPFPSLEGLAFLGIAYAASAAVLVWQRWEWLRVAAFALATVQVAAWAALTDGAGVATGIAVLSVFGLIGIALALGYELRVPAAGLRPSTSFLLATNAVVVGGIGVALLEWRLGVGAAGTWMGAVAVAHLAFGLALLHVRSASRPVAYLLLGVSLVAADVAFALLASGATLAVGWAVSALVLAALARRHGDGELVPLPLAGQLALAIAHTVLFADPAGPLVGEGAVPFAPLIAIGAAAFGCARLARPGDAGWRAAADAVALGALAYLTAASLDGVALVAAFGAEALALAHVARRTKEPLAEVGAFAFLGLALLHALAFEAPPTGLVDGVPSLAAAAGALAVIVGVAARFSVAQTGERRTAFGLVAGAGVVYALSLAIVTGLGTGMALDGGVTVSQQAQAVLSVFWALCGVGLLALGLGRHARTLRLCGFALLSLAVPKVFLFDMAALDAGYRVLSFIVLGLLLLAGAYAYQRMRRGTGFAA